MAEFDYDVVVVGSGFGGSVAALRLTEKGYRVLVIEAGRWFTRDTLPSTSWDLRSFLWAPRLGCYGIQRVHLLRNVVVLAGAGVGGGSLNYANTLYEPLDEFYDDPQWREITDWRAELAPYYDQAKRMLGVRGNPTVTPADVEIRAAAERLGVGETFRLTPVGVFFGDGHDADGAAPRVPPGEEIADPYFGGTGPARRACVECGSCMTGCRYGAKNMLTENYLYLAQAGGAQIQAMTTVTAVRERPDGGYQVEVRPTDGPRRARTTIATAQVILAAGTYGTQLLLHTMRDRGVLPRISPKLGTLTRTNSEALVGAMTYKSKVDFSRGVAISSSMYPNPRTHVEPVRYGKGSNAMGLLSVPFQVPGGQRTPRWLRHLGLFARHPVTFVRTMALLPRWSERTIIVLVMQSLDNSLRVSRKGGRFGGRGRLTSRQGHGEPNPTWIPEGQQVAELLAEAIDGTPGGTWGELFDVPMTAHFLGGCPIGITPEDGVIDPYHRLHGYPGIHVVDGAAVSANLGVNPSLTITAQAERAMAMWPNKGDADSRPAPGEPYRPVLPVPPQSPAVPDSAYGALKLG
ncbi:MAG TPA: GMC family oxidoreductase [Jiangellaceae bacterium]|nr:GMC family oxidoreductase [Jiangellaceae bacterium]